MLEKQVIYENPTKKDTPYYIMELINKRLKIIPIIPDNVQMADVDNLKKDAISSNFLLTQNSPEFSQGTGIDQDIHPKL